MYKKFTSHGHKKWLKILPEIIDKYNYKVHSTIKTTLMKGSKNPASIRGIVLRNDFENDLTLPRKKPKFKLVIIFEFSGGNLILKRDTRQSGPKRSL